MAILTTAKRLDIPVFLIGHITKEGTIAGPKTLEHMVDTVTYFEGDRFQDARLLRAFKNRFGPVGEVAMFRMHDDGLEEVPNPSAALISQRSQSPGSAILAAVEGTRPLLIEVRLIFQPIAYRWAQNLKPYDAPETNRFVSYYESMAGSSALELARSRATARWCSPPAAGCWPTRWCGRCCREWSAHRTARASAHQTAQRQLTRRIVSG